MPGVAGQCADGGIVDDRATALTFHLPQFLPHATPDAPQVDPDHAIPVFTGALPRGGEVGHDTGIVERGVETAELVNRPVDHCRHFGVVTHVTTDGERLVTSGD